MKLHYFHAVCSMLVVGLGQVIKGGTNKGIILLLTFYFFLPAAVYASLIINAYLFLPVLGFATIFGIMLWIYSVGDALLRS